MKQCPECKTTYTDDTLTYCLADGNALVATETEAETVVRQGVRVDIDPPKTLPVPSPVAEKKSGGAFLKIVLAVVLLVFLGLIVAGVAGALFYFNFNTDNSNIAAASPTPKPTATPTQTVDPEKERLQKELANLQKKLEDDAKAETNKTPPWSGDNDMPTATVNSPTDGFLALRSEPNSETGERLAQIPHGTVVELQNCEKQKIKIGSRTGRWCMVTYRGQTGWVFDAWLTY